MDSYYIYPGYYAAYDYPAPQGYDTAATYSDNTGPDQQEQINRLEDEVERLREERASRVQKPDQAAAQPATVLAFQDKHVEQVQNYAIVGETLWIFTEQRARKIPVSDLDIPATQKANDDRGVDFRLPDQK